MIDMDKVRVPLGSLAVDAALVIGIIYGAGKLTEQLDSISRRVERMEAQSIQPEADRRLAVVESRLQDMGDQMKHANEKLDELLSRRSR
jgi:hypothetical protein